MFAGASRRGPLGCALYCGSLPYRRVRALFRSAAPDGTNIVAGGPFARGSRTPGRGAMRSAVRSVDGRRRTQQLQQ